MTDDEKRKRNTEAARRWRLNNREKYLEAHKRCRLKRTWHSTIYDGFKTRAKKSGIAVTMTKEEFETIKIPDRCPVLDIPIIKNQTNHCNGFSPSVDRIDNSRGYEFDNVTIISQKANRIKNNATIEELEQVVAWMKLQT